ncbi:MAG: substrate-binding domain-containing protein [bacterium]|nr:substrate-binding domain-containing protein [bacterium]
MKKLFVVLVAVAAMFVSLPVLAEDVDLSGLKSGDGQPLLVQMEVKEIPERPADPEALPMEDPLHWYDMEYLGWGAGSEKVDIPEPPTDGAQGKSLMYIINGDHPYLTALSNGAQMVADAYGMELTMLSPNWDIAMQNQMLDEAIVEEPDMIILIPLDAKVAVQQVRKVNKAGIPILLSNMLPEVDAMKYVIGWAGPDDWGQFRMLTRVFADKMGKKGGVAFLQHAPGGSPYFARCFGPISELAVYAPDVKVLDMQAPGFKAEESMRVVSDWITRFGDELTGIITADDSAQAVGAIEAVQKAGRTDIVIVAAGNAQVGMENIKAGLMYAETYQNPEKDGAVAVKTAADWLNGKEIPPVVYMPKHVITPEDVENFMPGSW